MAEDIWSALNQTYIKSATAERDEQKSTITKGYTTEFKNDLDIIQRFAKKERDTFKEIAKEEAKLHQLSLQYKRDIFKQESQHYNNIYNLNAGIHKKQVSFLEQERDIRAEIAKSGKASLGDLASLYIKRKQLEELEKQSIEYKEQQFKKGVDNVKQAFRTITDHILKYFNERDNIMVWNQWESGIKNLGSAYEERFTEIAARTGSSSRIDTHNLIGSGLDKILADSELAKGLNFNSEVFPAITDAVQKGFMDEEAIEVAIDNAIDKKVAPWLDTSSETWVNLQYQLSDDMLAQLKGQQLLLQETREGNRILQNGVVSALLDELAPTLLNIDANTTDVTDLSGQAQSMVASLMANGYSKQDAVKVANQTIDAYQNPFNNLTGSSSTWQKLLAIGGLQGNDLAGAMNFATGAISPFNNGTWQAGGAVAANLGVPTNGFTRNTNYIEDLLNASKAANDYSKRGDLSSVYNMKVANINELITATQQNDNLKQNKAADSIFDKNLMRHGIDLAALQLNELKEIKTWLTTGLAAWVIGKFTDKLTDGIVGKFKGGGSTGSSATKLFSSGKGDTSAILSPKASGAMAGGLAAVGGAITGISMTYDESTAFTASQLEGKDAAKNTEMYQEYAKSLEKKHEAKMTGAVVGGVAGVAGGAVAGAAIGSAVPVVGTAIGAVVGGAIGLIGSLIGAEVGDLATELNSVVSVAAAQSLESLDLLKTNYEDEVVERQNLVSAMKDTNDIQIQQKMLIDAGIDSNLVNMAKTDEALDQLAQSALNAATANADLSTAAAGMMIERNSEADSGLLDYIGDNIVWDDDDSDKMVDKMYEIADIMAAAGVDSEKVQKIKDNADDSWWGGYDKGDLAEDMSYIKSIMTEDAAKALAYNYKTTYDTIDEINYNKFFNALSAKDKEGVISAINMLKHDTITGSDESTWDTLKKDETIVSQLSAMGIDVNSYRIGSSYIPYDQIALLHAGERVLTSGQNKEYSDDLISGNSSSSIIQAGIQDIVIAIKTQTSEIINYLSTMSFNNSSFGNSHINMLPTMGNTKVTL